MNDRRLSMILLAVMCISAMLVPVIALAVIPDHRLDKILDLPWSVIGPILVPVLTGGIAALWGFFTGPVTAPKPERVESLAPPTVPTRTRGRDGFAVIDALLVVVALACAATLLQGCGASALRVHVQTADGFHLAVQSAGETIEHACELDLSTCGMGDEVCVSQVERRCIVAAAARDALIVPATVYRSLALTAAGIDPDDEPVIIPDVLPPPNPGMMDALVVAAAAVMRGWPTLTAALAALTGGGQ